jgi:glutathione S-transferase
MTSRLPKHLRLISHKLCPYVQRAVIVATEKGVDFERVDIDLADKPDWFLAISPTGKVPLLEVTETDGSKHVLFESAVIAEYLDEISGNPLLPENALERARERAWVEFGAAALSDISRLYTAADGAAFEVATIALEERLEMIEKAFAGPWFAGDRFGLVDAAFAPVFRYIDVFQRALGTKLVSRSEKVGAWARALAERPSVIAAVPADYPDRLLSFVTGKNAYFSQLLRDRLLVAA